MNQLSSITPLEIILIGSAAVGVFLFFRACWRNIKRSRQHLSVALLTLMMSFTAQTAQADDSGSCGEGVNYTYTESTHTLTISGNGAMADYESKANQPWASYRNDITTLVIEDGITHIGNYAFYLFKTKKVTIPASVTSIGQYAFCRYDHAISFAEGSLLTSIGANAFENVDGSIDMKNCTKLMAITAENVFMYFDQIVTFPRTMTSVCKNAFKYGSKSPTIKMDCDGLLTVNGYETKEFVGTGSYDITRCFFVMINGSRAVTMKHISFSDMGVLNLDKNITASGYSTVEYDSKNYCCGTVTLGYTGTVPTGGIVKYAVNGEYISGNTFTIKGDAKVTAIVVYPYADISGLTYHGGTLSDIGGTTYDTETGGYYEIADEQDLIDLGNYTAASLMNTCNGLIFKLTADLDFSSRTTDDCQDLWGHGNFIPIGNFHGTFNGQGHTITGLRFTSESSCGLFGRIVSPAIVKNVTLINPQFTGTSSTGAIAGGADGGTFGSCTVAGGILSCSNGWCGGIIGSAILDHYNISIKNCIVVNTSVSGPSKKGIIVGAKNNGSNTLEINRSYYHTPEGLTICGNDTKFSGYMNYRVYQVTLGKGVTVTNEPKYAYGNKAYYQYYQDTYYSVTLGHNRPGYVFGGYQSDDVTITDGSFDMPQKDIIVNADWTDMFGMESGADGSAEHPYLISSTAGWDFFCDALQDNDTYNRFSGKTVKLAPSSGNSISVTRMAGSSSHKFTGTFDGDGKTLTVSYGTEAAPVSEEYAAPFRFVDGATIQNLHVEGSIISTVRRAAGVIGETGDNTSHITNCVSSSTISGGNFTGGFSIGGNVEIDGCVYNGKINGSGNSGGFVGYSQPTLKISNCLFAPQSGSSISGGTFYYNGGGNITPVNSYYTQKLGTAQGKQAYEVSAAPELLGEGTGDGIVKTYEYGLGFDKKYYLATIPLSETEGVIYLTDYLQGLEVPAEFKRTFSAGKASTICLPFAMDNVSGGKVYSFAGITYDEKDGWVATMSEAEKDGNNVTSTKANTPYVFMPDADGEVTFSGTTDEIPAAYDAENLTTTSGDWTFRGTYEPLKYGENLDGHVYGFASRDKEVDGVNVAAGEFVKAKDGAGVKPMRCYLTYKDNQEFVGARAVTRGIEENLPQSITVKFVSSTGNTTGIATLNTLTGEITTDDAWYTLSGTRLPGKPSQRGIYINKGNKVVIRY